MIERKVAGGVELVDSLRRPARLLAVLALSNVSACAFWEVSDWDDRTGLDAGTADALTASDGGLDEGGVPIFAKDQFERLVATGLGSADLGGAWTLGGASGLFAVSGGHASLTLRNPGDGVAMALPEVLTDDADVQVVVSTDKLVAGGVFFGVQARSVPGGDHYHARVVLRQDGKVTTSVAYVRGSTETALTPVDDRFTVAARAAVKIRIQVTGTNPTHLRLKVWAAADSEPATWAYDVVDTTPNMQAKGSFVLTAYVSGSATNTPVVAYVDDLLIRPASRVP